MKRISINFSKAHKNLLRAKLEYAKWPVQLDEDINNGISIEQVKELTDYWLNVYDWSSLERHLNQFNHYETEVAGQHLHFVMNMVKPNVVFHCYYYMVGQIVFYAIRK